MEKRAKAQRDAGVQGLKMEHLRPATVLWGEQSREASLKQ